MFRQVVGTILRLAVKHEKHWLAIKGSHDVPAYGFERIIDPPPLNVNTLRLLSEFHTGSLTLSELWASMLAPATFETVMELAAEAGRLGDAARTKLGIGEDVASATATHPGDGRGGQRVPLPRRRVGPRHLRPRRDRPKPTAPARDRWSRRSSRSTSDGSGASSSRIAT